MNLATYIKKYGREGIAKAINSSPGYVSQLAHGHRNITADTAIAIEMAVNGAVRCEEMCPGTDWEKWLQMRGNGAKPETDEAA